MPLRTGFIQQAAIGFSQRLSDFRLQQVRALWAKSQADQLEIGKLLYMERRDRLSVGGRGKRDGFHEWLRAACIPKASAYRRIAEYEITIGERERDPEDKPVSDETANSVPVPEREPIAEFTIGGEPNRVGGFFAHRVRDCDPPGIPPEVPVAESKEPSEAMVRLLDLAEHHGFGATNSHSPCQIRERTPFSRWSDFGNYANHFTLRFSVKDEAEAQELLLMWALQLRIRAASDTDADTEDAIII